ncbi:MAG: tetratricopeptide repeat protein, partial [Candidatus Eremiobacteraeota bacterium]|nr:tetratricopeptide repeat protein [Candidatus Eremiobacteraeota bacterium]
MTAALRFGQSLRWTGVVLMAASLACAIGLSGAGAFVRDAVLLAMPRTVATAPPTAESVDLADRFYRAVRKGDYAAAIPYGRRYLDLNPQANAFAMDLAHAYVAAGRYEDARSLLYARASYLRANPHDASLWLDLAYKESARRHYVRSIDDIDQYLQYRPGDPKALAQRRYDVASITPAPPDTGARFYEQT